jgi:hypothetical protein
MVRTVTQKLWTSVSKCINDFSCYYVVTDMAVRANMLYMCTREPIALLTLFPFSSHCCLVTLLSHCLIALLSHCLILYTFMITVFHSLGPSFHTLSTWLWAWDSCCVVTSLIGIYIYCALTCSMLSVECDEQGRNPTHAGKTIQWCRTVTRKLWTSMSKCVNSFSCHYVITNIPILGSIYYMCV